MALSSAITWEVRQTGADTNGGGFKTGASGTDWTLQDAAQYSVTDGVTAGTTTITSATANFGTDVVGNVIYVQGGTGSVTAGWYEITSRTNSTTIVVDRSTGLTAGTGVTLKIGGALASPALVAANKVAGTQVFIKYNATPYSCTTASTNVAGGMVLENTGAADTAQSFWVGYDTTRTNVNTDANRPTMQASGAITNFTVFAASALNVSLRNIILDGNSKTGAKGAQFNASFGGGRLYNVKALNCPGIGFDLADFTSAYFCEANGCGGTAAFYLGASGATAMYCVARSSSGSCPGFVGVNNSVVVRCISISNGGHGFQDSSTAYCRFVDCIAYSNTLDGFLSASGAGRANTFINCIAVSNAGTGFKVSVADAGATMINCAYYNNTTANVSGNITFNLGGILLTGVPFTDAAGNDFTLNNVASQGAALRSLGFPRTWPGLSTTNYLDIGATQHQDPAGGTTTISSGVIGE